MWFKDGNKKKKKYFKNKSVIERIICKKNAAINHFYIDGVQLEARCTMSEIVKVGFKVDDRNRPNSNSNRTR